MSIGRSTLRSASRSNPCSTDIQWSRMVNALNTATLNLADIVQCTYIPKAGAPHQLSIDVLNTPTLNLPDVEDIAQCTYILKADGAPPSQSSIDALNTTTPKLAHLKDIAQCTYIPKADGPPSIKHCVV